VGLLIRLLFSLLLPSLAWAQSSSTFQNIRVLSLTPGNCVQVDSNHLLVAAAAPCGSGGGGGGNVTGPGSSTPNFLPQWVGSSGMQLGLGLPVGLTGANTVVETTSGGTITLSLIPVFTSIANGLAPLSGGGTSNFLRADGTWAAPAGGGNVTGPVSSTNNNVATWNGTSGTALFNGPPYGTTGNNTLLETGAGGLIAASVLPNPSASTLGGVESIAAVSHNFLTSISTSGVPAQAQPAFTDISGSITYAQFTALSANQVLGALTATTPSGLSVPSCSGATSALQYTSGVGFGCGTVGGAGGTAQVQDFVAPGDFTPGTTTSLTVSSTPVSAAALQITFDGVKQASDTWSLATATITFNAAIPLSVQVVEAQWVITAGSTSPGGSTCDVQFNSAGSFAGNAGLCYTGSNNLAIGISGSTVGTVQLFNGTSGSISIAPPTGALGSVTLTLPDLTDTILTVTSTATITNKTISGLSNTLTNIALTSLANQAANTILGNATAGSAAPTALAIPPCSTASSALTWTTSGGAGAFGCNSIAGGSGSPGGSDTNVQYNHPNGTFAGSAALTFNNVDTLGIGTAGSVVGKIAWRNATSGAITLQAPTGALGTPTLTWPDTTGIVLCDVCVQTLTNSSISGAEINSGLVAGQFGGTGVNNTGKTITLGGNLTTAGAFNSTFTMTGTTSVTFPTSGTLLTTTGNGSGLTGLTYSQFPAIGANTVLGALTSTTPSALSVPSCSAANNALIFTSGVGFGCSSIANPALWANVVSFGADPTGSASSSTAIASAFASQPNIFFPCGTYLVTAAISPPSNSEIRGAAYGCVTINQSGLNPAAVGIFDITTATNNVQIFNMICGSYTNGSCLWDHGGQTFFADWLGVVGNMFACAFFDSNTPQTPGPIPPGATDGGYDLQPFISHLQCNAATQNALSTFFTSIGVGVGLHGTHPAGVYLMAPNIMNSTVCGVDFINSTGAIIIGPGEFLGNGSDVCTNPGVGQVAFSTNISDVYMDYATSGANYKILSAGGVVQNFHVTNTWANSALPNGNGMLFNPGSGTITQVSVVGGLIGGGNDAVCIMGGDNFDFDGVQVNGGRSSPGSYNGYTINGAGAVHLRINGGTSGSIPELSPTQHAGVWIGNAAVGAGFCQQGSRGNPDYISITGADLTGNIATEVDLQITPTHYSNIGGF
jgi:hypothetical protein